MTLKNLLSLTCVATSDHTIGTFDTWPFPCQTKKRQLYRKWEGVCFLAIWRWWKCREMFSIRCLPHKAREANKVQLRILKPTWPSANHSGHKLVLFINIHPVFQNDVSFLSTTLKISILIHCYCTVLALSCKRMNRILKFCTDMVQDANQWGLQGGTNPRFNLCRMWWD